LFAGPKQTPLPEIVSGTPRTTQYERERILWVSGKESVLHLYLPILSCRFIANGGMFKACSVHMLSENLTWMSSLKMVAPHLAFLAVVSFAFSRAWCGWVCPLGAIMDFMTGVRRRLGIDRKHLSRPLGRFLENTRHFLLFFSLGLAALIAVPAISSTDLREKLFLFYCQLCPARLAFPPFGAINPCWYDSTSALTMFMTLLGWVCLGFFLGSFLVPRLWCRVCAVGALLSYFNRGGLLALNKRAERCTFCGACERVCPMDIERVYREREKQLVTDTRCMLCLRCVEECPEEGCLDVRWAGIGITRSKGYG